VPSHLKDRLNQQPVLSHVSSNRFRELENVETQPNLFLSHLAQEIAERVAGLVVHNLPRPNLILSRYLTVAQAAEYVSHTKRSFEYLIRKDLFPVVRRDRLVLIDREDLDRTLARWKQ
jgi:excisionase family DNA binding protein